MKKLILLIAILITSQVNAGIGYMLNTPIQPMGIATSNTNIENTGFMIATGDAMGWDDVAYQSIISAKATGTGALTLTTITGNIQGYAFTINDSMMISAEMAHRWKIGTPVSIHAHVMNKSVNAADRFMKFTFEYVWADINGQIISEPVIVSNNFTVPGGALINTAYYVELAPLANVALTQVSGHIMGKLTRVTATGTAVASDPIVLSFGVHGQVDSLGSRQEYIK